MASCLFVVALLAFALYEGQAIKRSSLNCHLAVSGSDISGILAPYHLYQASAFDEQAWRMIDGDNLWSDVELKSDGYDYKLFVGVNEDPIKIQGNWDSATRCLSNPSVDNSTFIYVVDPPIQSPFVGRDPNSTEEVGHTVPSASTMQECYTRAKNWIMPQTGETPTACEWNYKTKECHFTSFAKGHRFQASAESKHAGWRTQPLGSHTEATIEATVPNCYLAVSAPDVRGIFAPHQGYQAWRMIDEHGRWTDIEFRKWGTDHYFFIAGRRDPRKVEGSWDSATRCWSSAHGNSTTLVYVVDHPIRPPLIGYYEALRVTSESIRNIQLCYNFAKKVKLPGTQEHAHGFTFSAHKNEKYKNCRVFWYEDTIDLNRDGYRSQLLKPMQAPGTTKERIYLGRGDGDDCIKLAEKKRVTALTLTSTGGQCYYSSKTDIQMAYTDTTNWVYARIPQ